MIIYLSPKCLKSVEKTDFFPQNQDSDNPEQKSLGQYYNTHIFLSFLGSLSKQCILLEIFSQFSFPPPNTNLKLGKNSGYTRPTLFVEWGEGLDLCELENTQKRKSVPRLLSMIVWKRGEKKKGSLEGFSSLLECLFGILMKDRNWTNLFPAFRSFVNVF